MQQSRMIREARWFTPLDALRCERLGFMLARVEVLSGTLDTRSPGMQARVRIDDKLYDVFGYPCELEGCYCDAYIVPVPGAEVAA